MVILQRPYWNSQVVVSLAKRSRVRRDSTRELKRAFRDVDTTALISTAIQIHSEYCYYFE